MPGGLIQIASYGIHDIFLIGNPQITFFKTIYRRHSNFSMEYIEEQLNGTQNYGGYLSCNLSKSGDLLHKLYLKINIPEINLDKFHNTDIDYNNNVNSINEYNNFNTYVNDINFFINQTNYYIIQPLYKLLNINANKLKYNDIYAKYKNVKNKMNYTQKLEYINTINIAFFESFYVPLDNTTYIKVQNNETGIYILNGNNYQYDKNNGNYVSANKITAFQTVNISQYLDFDAFYNRDIASQAKESDLNTIFQQLLNSYLLQIKIIKQKLVTTLQFYKDKYQTAIRNKMYFAWTEYIGHQLINRIEIDIGGKVIDFTDSVKMNIHFQLTNKIMHDETYNKLIGNVDELKTFNSNIKPAYTLYVPIEFWFGKYSGLSIPLIFLRYHDVKINVKLNDLVNCCYYEKLKADVLIEDIVPNLESVTLIANYIYLDSDERKKFAQLNHEYLIDQTQVAEYTDIKTQKLNIELSFFNPIKQLFWLIRDQNNLARLKYFDYSTSYYVDIYEFLSSSDGIIKIRTVEQMLSNNINIGDTINICNSIYYTRTYIVHDIQNEYLFIKFNKYYIENYSYNYNIITENNITFYQKSDSYVGNSQAYIVKVNNSNPFLLSTLELNGIQRFYKVDSNYSNFVQPYQHNSRTPNYGINSYSFALYPEEYQPSGFCNFNRLDLKTMIFEFNNNYITSYNSKNLIIYAHGYNILRFAYGKAGIILNI
jgi:hypothetical protein